MTAYTDAVVEEAAFSWQVAHGPDIAPDASSAERDDYRQVVLEQRLRDPLGQLNPHLLASEPADAFCNPTPEWNGPPS